MPKKKKQRLKGSRGGSRPKAKGSAYEYAVVKKFRALGIECGTTRGNSKSQDAMGIDIHFPHKLPLNIQCKWFASYKNPIPYIEVMPDDEKYNVVFEKINHKGGWVTLKEDDFMEIVALLIKEKLWKE